MRSRKKGILPQASSQVCEMLRNPQSGVSLCFSWVLGNACTNLGNQNDQPMHATSVFLCQFFCTSDQTLTCTVSFCSVEFGDQQQSCLDVRRAAPLDNWVREVMHLTKPSFHQNLDSHGLSWYSHHTVRRRLFLTGVCPTREFPGLHPCLSSPPVKTAHGQSPTPTHWRCCSRLLWRQAGVGPRGAFPAALGSSLTRSVSLLGAR